MDRFRGLICVVSTAAALFLAPAATSAAEDPAEPADKADSARLPAVAPPSVEDLLDKLSKSADKEEAGTLEREIVSAWNHSGSDTVDLLLERAGVAMQEKNFGLALQYLDTIVGLKPDFAEGWNMRATVYYLLDEYELSLADIQHVLALQPRHFGALSGLGMIFRELDEPEKALEAFREVLKVHPYFGKARESAEKLEKQVEGQDI